MGPFATSFAVFFAVLNAAHGTKVSATIKLNDGNEMPIVSLGTYDVYGEEMRKVISWAVEDGYRNIDTATMYENEEAIGKGIADVIAKGLVRREDLFVITKLWYNRHARCQVVPALKKSLELLRLKYVDLYMIHVPAAYNDDGTQSNIDYLETWRGLEDAQQLGLVKSIGVSNFNVSQIDRLFASSKVKPAVNQIEVHPSLTEESLVTHCQDLGVAVMAHSPLGFLVNRNRTDTPPPHADDPLLIKIATKYKKSTIQIVLRYLIERGLAPIPKSANKEHLAANINLFDFHLTTDEVVAINKFNKNVRIIKFDELKGHPYYPF